MLTSQIPWRAGGKCNNPYDRYRRSNRIGHRQAMLHL
jgi:hypothetical protein